MMEISRAKFTCPSSNARCPPIVASADGASAAEEIRD
jgi:hypothetical protein